jgi:hypothetical protein
VGEAAYLSEQKQQRGDANRFNTAALLWPERAFPDWREQV